LVVFASDAAASNSSVAPSATTWPFGLQLSSCASRFYFDLHSNNDDDELDFFSEKKKKERLQWEGFAEKGFKSGMEERVGDEK